MESHVTDKLLDAADDLACERLSEARYDHTIRVADTAKSLAKRHGLDPSRARLAALIHDAARELPKPEYLRLAAEWEIPTGDEERASPKLLHGAVAAELARRELGVQDEEILQAVREHTVGAAPMCDISLVLYLADKIEPARDYPSVGRIREISLTDLRGATIEALRRSIAYNELREKPVHPASREALAWLERESRERQAERAPDDGIE